MTSFLYLGLVSALLFSVGAAVEKGEGEGEGDDAQSYDVQFLDNEDQSAQAPSPAFGPPLDRGRGLPKVPKPIRRKEETKKGLQPLVAPFPLARMATDLTIPSLGGKHQLLFGTPNKDSGRLTNQITGFRLRKSHDNVNREIVRLTGGTSGMYLTRKADMTFNGRTYLYDPMDFGNKGPHGVITMGKGSAAARLPPFDMALDKVAGMKYEINSYTKSCANQQSVGKDKVDRRPLYSFARLTRPAISQDWKVVRIDCDSDGNPQGKEAYKLKHMGDGQFNVISGRKEPIGVLKRHDQSETDFADGWLSAGEDPLLFGAILMVTMEPQTPT